MLVRRVQMETQTNYCKPPRRASVFPDYPQDEVQDGLDGGELSTQMRGKVPCQNALVVTDPRLVWESDDGVIRRQNLLQVETRRVPGEPETRLVC